MNKNKIYAILILISAVLFISFSFNKFKNPEKYDNPTAQLNPKEIFSNKESQDNTKIEEVPYKKEASIIINYIEDEMVGAVLEINDSSTVSELLFRLAEIEEIEIESTQYDFGIFIEAINGYENSEELSWIYFVNGESGQVAADQQNVGPGDIVVWKYTEPIY